jgi:hypothetical protein
VKIAGFMSQRFRVRDLNQPLLLPPSPQDWLPERHPARFIGDAVDGLDVPPDRRKHEPATRGAGEVGGGTSERGSLDRSSAGSHGWGGMLAAQHQALPLVHGSA